MSFGPGECAASAARSVLSAQLIFAVILVQQLRILSLIAGKYSHERVLATNGLAPTMVLLIRCPKSKGLRSRPNCYSGNWRRKLTSRPEKSQKNRKDGEAGLLTAKEHVFGANSAFSRTCGGVD